MFIDKTSGANASVQETLRLNGETMKTVKADWETYMRAGVIVTLHVSYWRGASQLASDDLGIDEVGRRELIKLGRKELLPKIPQSSPLYRAAKPDRRYTDELLAIETSIRNAVDRVASPTPWGRFVAAQNLQEAIDLVEKQEQRLYAVRDEIADNWDAVCASLAGEYTAVAQASWKRAMAIDADRMGAMDWVKMDNYVKQFLDRIARAMPGVQSFRDSFKVKREFTYIPLPDILAKEKTEAKRIYDQYEIDRAVSKITLLEIDGRKRQIDEMNEIVVAQARRDAEEMIDGFFSGVMGDMLTQIIDAASSALTTIGSNGRIMGKTTEQLAKLVDTINKKNFMDVPGMSDMLRPIMGELRVKSESRNVTAIQQKLEALKEQAQMAMIEVTRSTKTRGRAEVIEEFVEQDEAVRRPRSSRVVEILDDFEEVTEARGRGRSA